MKHYLYGFTIHSIQGYIFQTYKLKEIAGASELVEQICTTEFAKMIDKDFEGFKDDPYAIRNAAGNIRYIFTDETLCKKVVREFPKRVLEFAPGVQICQAVIGTEEMPGATDFEKLEKLLTDQRNSPIRPVDLGYMAINRSRKTGLPSVERETVLGEEMIYDRATKKKLDLINHQKISRINLAFFGEGISDDKVPVDVEKIVASKNSEYSWLAVIHADGNNMGLALQNLGKEEMAKTNYPIASQKFSRAIDLSTKTAAQKAFLEVFPQHKIDNTSDIPFRPIIVGGDDLTVVCRADLALAFTKAYLEKFEEQTEINFAGFELLKNGLTACAGIAFIKVSYPFHYAVNLAEKLCEHAKKDAKLRIDEKGRVPSCLMFHKVQDSFVERYQDIIERELTAEKSVCRFDFGPYYVNQEPKIEKLLENIKQLDGKEGNAIKSTLRQWLKDLHYNKSLAEQRMNRLLTIGDKSILEKLKLEKNYILNGKSPVYDWLTIMSLNAKDYNDDDN